MNHTILIVDGHPVFINKIEGFLKGLTFQNLHLAPKGQEGVSLAKELQPELVILSGMLPDMDSHQVCQMIKAESPSSRVIVLIGLFTDTNSITKFKELGADIVLPRKEKDLNPLNQAVEELLGLKVNAPT